MALTVGLVLPISRCA